MKDDDSDDNDDLGGMHDASDSDEEDLDANLGFDLPNSKKEKEKPKRKSSHDKIEVNFDDLPDDDDQECLLDYKQQGKQPLGLLDQ